jgi:hypothetical protein
MRHPGNKPRFVWDRCGPLFVIYWAHDDIVEWFVCPDAEDKCEERAIAMSHATTVEEAMTQVAAAITAIAHDMLAWVVAPSSGVREADA